MEAWDLTAIDVEPHAPRILRSDDGAARVIALRLPAGERLQDHEVHEHAWLTVVSGAVELVEPGRSVSAGAGTLVHWDPQERHEVQATRDALLVLTLAPWPGPGHPSTRQT